MNERPDASKLVSDIDDLLRGIWKQLDEPEGLCITILKLSRAERWTGQGTIR